LSKGGLSFESGARRKSGASTSSARTGEGTGLQIHAAGDRLQLADALLEVGELDPRRAFAGAAFDLPRWAAGLKLAVLQREPALPALQHGGGDHDQAEKSAGRDQQVLGHNHPVPPELLVAQFLD